MTVESAPATNLGASESPVGKSVTIKLSDIANTYMDVLQRLFDYSAMTLGSMRQINEEGYDEFSRSLGIMPANKSRLGYDEAKEETERWLLKHCVSEGLGVAILALSDCRTVCALSRWKAEGNGEQEKLKTIVTVEKQAFDQLPLEEKFSKLREDFGVETPFEDHVMRLVKLRQALVAKGGAVTADEANGEEVLEIRLKVVQLETAPMEGSDLSSLKVSTKLGDLTKKLRVGSKVRLTKSEHVGIVITLAFFLSSVLESVQSFGRRSGAY